MRSHRSVPPMRPPSSERQPRRRVHDRSTWDKLRVPNKVRGGSCDLCSSWCRKPSSQKITVVWKARQPSGNYDPGVSRCVWHALLTHRYSRLAHSERWRGGWGDRDCLAIFRVFFHPLKRRGVMTSPDNGSSQYINGPMALDGGSEQAQYPCFNFFSSLSVASFRAQFACRPPKLNTRKVAQSCRLDVSTKQANTPFGANRVCSLFQ